MAIDYQIEDRKLSYEINREAAKISALTSSKIMKYEYLTAEEILPSNQKQIIEQGKFTYSSLGKALEITKNDFNADKICVLLDKQNEMFKSL